MITVGEWLWGVNFKFHTSQVEIENTHWSPHFCLNSLLIKPFSKYIINIFFFIFYRRWNPQGWLYQASRWIGRSWGWRWFLRLRSLLGQIVRQGINHSTNQNPIKRLVDFFNGENHFQTAHNLWHITSTMLQNGGLKNRLKKTIKTQKLNYQIFGNRTMAIQNGEPERKKYGKLIDCILFWSIFSVK